METPYPELLTGLLIMVAIIFIFVGGMLIALLSYFVKRTSFFDSIDEPIIIKPEDKKAIKHLKKETKNE